jgi:hypothetical protein
MFVRSYEAYEESIVKEFGFDAQLFLSNCACVQSRVWTVFACIVHSLRAAIYPNGSNLCSLLSVFLGQMWWYFSNVE